MLNQMCLADWWLRHLHETDQYGSVQSQTSKLNNAPVNHVNFCLLVEFILKSQADFYAYF